MALLASILHDDPLAANPITVLRAIRRVGWGCLAPCLLGRVRGAAGGRRVRRRDADRRTRRCRRSCSGSSGSSPCTRRWWCSGCSACSTTARPARSAGSGTGRGGASELREVAGIKASGRPTPSGVVREPTSLGPSRDDTRLATAEPAWASCLVRPARRRARRGPPVLLPPVLRSQSLPVFDVIAMIDPFDRGTGPGLRCCRSPRRLLLQLRDGLGLRARWSWPRCSSPATRGEDDQPAMARVAPARDLRRDRRWLWAGRRRGAGGLALGDWPIALAGRTGLSRSSTS